MLGEVEDLAAETRPFRVLCLDGGGMRGLYTAAYLDCVATGFSRKRKCGELDLGAAFDLIVGTSTGAIIGCALAAGISPAVCVRLYREHGKEIFPRRMPAGFGWKLVGDVLFGMRKRAVARGGCTLRKALTDCFGKITVGELFAARHIALAVPAVELGHHKSWVFKTAHLTGKTNQRDDRFSLVDVCLASSASPLFRSLAQISGTTQSQSDLIFADGGLWANNPVLVGLIDALAMTGPGRAIEIYCMGTCPLPAGEDSAKVKVHRGLTDWKFGAEAAKLAIDAQEYAYDFMAKMLARHVDRACTVMRFPRDKVPAALMPYLDLDDTREEAAKALLRQANADADMTNSRCGDPNDAEGQLVNRLFMTTPERNDDANPLTAVLPPGVRTQPPGHEGE
jgi:hypothetical protein